MQSAKWAIVLEVLFVVVGQPVTWARGPSRTAEKKPTLSTAQQQNLV